MTEREPISKKLRFEVFKRDSFTCQYCGEKAPDVVLHIDHIRPVDDGGGSDILNLVTSCVACNLGKGARLLDDSSVIERQRMQLQDLQERREQLEMMLAWRDGLERTRADTVALVSDRICERGGFYPNESGANDIRKWLKTYSFDEVLTALDEAFDIYMKFKGDEPDKRAWETAFKKIPAIASINRQAVEKPYIPKLCYIQGILRKRSRRRKMRCVEALEQIHVDEGTPLDVMERIAKQAESWEDYCERIDIHQAARNEV